MEKGREWFDGVAFTAALAIEEIALQEHKGGQPQRLAKFQIEVRKAMDIAADRDRE